MTTDITVTFHGPLFDRNPMEILNRWADDLADSYGRQGLSLIGQIMDESFKHPTPYYETQVVAEALADFGGGGLTGGGGSRVIHDRGIAYGPWLEGVGRRNQTTRFKGYHMFRRTWQALIEDSSIVERAVPSLIEHLGGG